MAWADLPLVLKKMLPNDDKTALVKATRDGDSLVLTLITTEAEQDPDGNRLDSDDSPSMPDSSPDAGKLAPVINRPKPEVLQ